MSRTQNPSLRIKRVSLADAVVDQMVEAIKSGRFQLGEKIPSEKILTKEFGVSRTTLREAYKKLEYLGAISIKQGDGTYLLDKAKNLEQELTQTAAREGPPLAAAPAPDLEVPFDNAVQAAIPRIPLSASEANVRNAIQTMFSIGNYQLSHYIGARECIECAAIDFAVTRMREIDIAEFQDILTRQKQALQNPVSFVELDYLFHERIIIASRNEFLYTFWNSLKPYVEEQVARLYKVPGFIESASAAHERIFSYLLKGENRKAKVTDADHLRIISGRMLTAAAKQAGGEGGIER